MNTFFIEPANFNLDFDELHELRQAVFIVEQQIPADIEFDELDPYCHHYIVRDSQCHAIATARLTADGKIGRMAVLPQWRQQGVGRSLLHALLDKARGLGLSQVSAHAQVTALGFYEKQGFVRQGEIFMEAGIPHQLIQCLLQVHEKPERINPQPRQASIEATKLENLEATTAAVVQLISQGRRQLCLYSRDLDHALYGQAVVVEGFKQFVLGNRQSRVQILLQDPLALQSRTHPLLGLVQRLPSYFLIRTPLENADLQYPSAFLINDVDGYLFRLLDHRYEGHWSPNLPIQNRSLCEEFERVWQRARPCAEFRALEL